MRTSTTKTKCHCCGRQVEDVMHVMLCDCCLDARLARAERTPRPLALSAAALLEKGRTASRIAFV
jgi:NMD protein affecting ribosome stability and mRNA decay